MSDLAPGQLLGYTLQYFRALYYLVVGYPGYKVGIEKIADVDIELPDGTSIVEEDKSSISKSPITNRSTDLWKTLHNWIAKISSGELDVEKTNFILFSNRKGRKAIIDLISEAKSKANAETVVKIIKNELSDIDDNHEIWHFYDCVMNKKNETFIELIPKVTYDTACGISISELKTELTGRKQIPETQQDFFIEKMVGWLVRTISEKIIKGETPIISWEEYDIQSRLILERMRLRELVDFTSQKDITNDDVLGLRTKRAGFIRQLDWIDANEQEIIRATSDYLKNQINIGKWQDAGLIDKESYQQFEDRLIRNWEAKSAINELSICAGNESKIGRKTYYESISFETRLNSQIPLPSTIPGTYHALANDEGELGWHPYWRTLSQAESSDAQII